MEGGATRAATVATWALVRAQRDVLFGVAALRSFAARRFLMRSCLAESVGMMVGVTLLCTLGTDGCESMDRRNSWHVGCLHPRKLLYVGGSGRCCNVLESFRLCLYMGFCCLYDSLEVLCCLQISGAA